MTKRGRTHQSSVVELGKRIRYFRARLGMTQEDLARAARLTPKFVSQIENGRVNPSIGVLARVVQDGFRITLGVFFMWDPDRVDISAMLALLARQPTDHHRRIVRAVEVLCDDVRPEAAATEPAPVARGRRNR